MKLSVLIPCYNEPELVIKAIQSVPKRDDIEIIVCDDDSDDNTFYELLNYRNTVMNDKFDFILLYNEENKGVGYTVNKLIDNAKGEYIVLLGSDDYFITEEFEKAIEELDGTDLVYFNLQINDGTIFRLSEDTKKNYCGSTKFIKKSFLGNTRNPDKRAREDYYFYNELLKKNPTEKFTDLTIKHYNFPRKGSLTDLACKGLI